MGWREEFENIAGGRRTVELSVALPPAEVLQTLRTYLVSEGPYGATVETDRALEVEDRSGLGGCTTLILVGILVTFFTFGFGLILLVLWAFTKFRRLRIEAVPSGSDETRLTVSGYPQQAVTEAEEWIRGNLPIEERG